MCMQVYQLPLFGRNQHLIMRGEIARAAATPRLVEIDGVYMTEDDAALTQAEREAKGIFLPDRSKEKKT